MEASISGSPLAKIALSDTTINALVAANATALHLPRSRFHGLSIGDVLCLVDCYQDCGPAAGTVR